jgi:hypothetical protein
MERNFDVRLEAASLPPMPRGTIDPAVARPLWRDHPPWRAIGAPMIPIDSPPHRRFLIRGITRQGRTFRPSDWAERLAGAMSSFRPEGAAGGIGAYIGYSPLCVPRLVEGVKTVIVDESLRDVEPMAWDFVMNFARDNDLQVAELTTPLPEN